ncbi:MAG: helix-turn-helix domain-containing protein [Planctomycetes bacterium]|nr:helix-turn-helix domain-containing protein [Planctomycetota bacterium]MBL7009385.1 helix-turn-helix domain-containing protein [Planctomycetota bacterium]
MSHSHPPARRLLEALAHKVRQTRHARGLSLQETSVKAGFSRRFLVEIEAARANPSIGKLAALADALCLPLRELCDLPGRGVPTHRIAMIGLRGAGKSTVGFELAKALEIPFSELDDVIQERAGLTVSEIFELHGSEGYRRLETESLEEWLTRHGSGVLAVPGGVVASPYTYERLLGSCRTVWLQAAPEEHMDRVVAQGDLRPMNSHPEAMERLMALLTERSPQYQRAEIKLSTSGKALPQIVGELRDLIDAQDVLARA